MKFKELAVNRYFCFEGEGEEGDVYRKISKGKIRKYGHHAEAHYFKNEPIVDLGEDIYQFTVEIHLRIKKTVAN